MTPGQFFNPKRLSLARHTLLDTVFVLPVYKETLDKITDFFMVTHFLMVTHRRSPLEKWALCLCKGKQQ